MLGAIGRDDGLFEIDNNAVERALCAVAIGRENYLFAGSDTAKLNDVDPEADLRDLLTRITDYPINRIVELLPWNVKLRVSLGAGQK